jgi:hypothetical protein
VLNKKPQNNLQVTKNRVSDTTKEIAHSSQNVNSVISAANVGDNTRKFAALDHNRTRDYIYQLGKNKCSDGKLRTYVKIKTVYGRENCLSLMFLLNSELL